MNIRAFLFILLCTAFLQRESHAQNYGLEFASFTALKDFRTGLNLNPKEVFSLKENFELSFNLNLYRRSQIFGYILRAIINDTLNIDIQTSYNQNQSARISVIVGQHIYNFSEWNIDQKLFDKWEEFKIKFNVKENKIVFTKGSSDNVIDCKLPKKALISVNFGAISSTRFITTDVPPMHLKDIRIFQNSRLMFYWPLNEKSGNYCSDIIHGKVAEVSNPHWLEPRYSQWKLSRRFSFKGIAIATFNKRNEEIYFLKEDSLLIYSLRYKNFRGFNFPEGNQVINADSRLIFDESTNSLFHYYLDTKDFIKFDTLTHKWDGVMKESSGSKRDYTQHNGFYSGNDSSFYFFGGYGFYKYKSSLFRYHIPTHTLSEVTLRGDVLTPRYLASSGILPHSDSIYILGGYGNTSGDQRINPQSFKDLYLINLTTGVSKKVCNLNQLPDDDCFARSFCLFPADNSFYALSFTKHRYLSWLKLIKGNTQTGDIVFPGDSIPFLFEDTRSSVDLFMSERRKELACLTSICSEKYDSTQFELYTIEFPPNIPDGDIVLKPKTTGRLMIGLMILSVAVIIGLLVFLIKKLKNKAPAVIIPKNILPSDFDSHHPNSITHAKNAIFFLGEFQIFDKEGTEISKLFSPLLKELFLLIFFYSQNERQGISTEMLNQFLWFDKDSSQARNNRSVNMSKLRLNISRIEGISLSKRNGYWQMEIQADRLKCDYLDIAGYIAKGSVRGDKVSDFLALIKRGPLLEEANYEWLDKVKSEFTNSILDLLLDFENAHKKDLDLNIKIADVIFVHDPLNEMAVKIKYNSLIALGRHHLAKNVLEQFKLEYLSLYGEPFNEANI